MSQELVTHRRPQAVAAPQVDWDAALAYLDLSPKNPKAVALRLVCQRYGLDPLLGHVTLYDGKPYIHFSAYLHIANEHPAYLGAETVREWDDETWCHATVRVHRSDRDFPSERTGKSRKVKKKKDGSTYTDDDADAKAFAQAFRRALRLSFNIAHPEPGEDEHDPTPAPAPVVEVARMATDPTLMPSVELVQSIQTTEQAKDLVTGPAVGDRYREAVREAQMRLIGEVWADFWRAADRDSWVAVLLEARRLLSEQLHQSSRQPSGPGAPPAPPAIPPGPDLTSGAGEREGAPDRHDPASDLNASATGPGDTGVSAGQEPPNAEASTPAPSTSPEGAGTAGRGRKAGRAAPGKVAAPSDLPPAAPSDEAEQAAFEQTLADDDGRFAR